MCYREKKLCFQVPWFFVLFCFVFLKFWLLSSPGIDEDAPTVSLWNNYFAARVYSGVYRGCWEKAYKPSRYPSVDTLHLLLCGAMTWYNVYKSWEKRVTLCLHWGILIRTQISESWKNHLYWILRDIKFVTLNRDLRTNEIANTNMTKSCPERQRPHGLRAWYFYVCSNILETFSFLCLFDSSLPILSLLTNSLWDKRWELASLV